MIKPNSCGQSIKIGGVYICRLACAPCKEPCEEERIKNAVDALAKAFVSMSEDNDNQNKGE